MTAVARSGDLQSATRPRPYAAVRTLQIEAEGDFCKGLIKPKIPRVLTPSSYKAAYRAERRSTATASAA